MYVQHISSLYIKISTYNLYRKRLSYSLTKNPHTCEKSRFSMQSSYNSTVYCFLMECVSLIFRSMLQGITKPSPAPPPPNKSTEMQVQLYTHLNFNLLCSTPLCFSSLQLITTCHQHLFLYSLPNPSTTGMKSNITHIELHKLGKSIISENRDPLQDKIL